MDDRDQLIVALERELHRLRCQNRRLAEELDWRDEKDPRTHTGHGTTHSDRGDVMARTAFATQKLIAPGSNDPRITPTQVILHVDAGNADSLHDYFAHRSGGVESHFHIKRDGTIEQYRDTDWQADANHTANDRAISVETQGYGEGEWTPQQLASIKRLLEWARDTHGIPLRPCPTHDAPGVGYHVMFGAPGAWTPVAKSCPGPDRIRQFNEVLVPWMTGTTKPAATGDDMALDDKVNDDRTVRQVLRRLDNFITRSDQRHKAILAQGKQAQAQLAQVRAAVAGNATRDEIAALLEGLDATIQLVIKEES